MGAFTQAMITSDRFTWRLKSGSICVRGCVSPTLMCCTLGESVAVNALKFPIINGLSFSTDLQLAGMHFFFLFSTCRFHSPRDLTNIYF
jgi:hypothetical protein